MWRIDWRWRKMGSKETGEVVAVIGARWSSGRGRSWVRKVLREASTGLEDQLSKGRVKVFAQFST